MALELDHEVKTQLIQIKHILKFQMITHKCMINTL